MIKEIDIAGVLSAPIFQTISNIADELNIDAYIIGGYVRDLFLQRKSHDIDIVTVGSSFTMAEALAAKLGKKAKLHIFKNYGTAHIAYKDYEIEFVGARKESYNRNSRNPIVEDGTLEDDQNRRDFTINALAISLNKTKYGLLLDPFGGLSDMENRIIKTPLDPDITFSDDPLRMMRGIRFATQLNFDIESKTFEAIARNTDRIKIISKERIAEELNKIILSKKPSIGFRMLYKTGLLEIIFKELYDLKGVQTKDGIGHKDNFYHTLQVLDNIAKHTDNLWLRWAAILHDIGKPRTKKWDDKLGWTFHNHNFVGKKMVCQIFKNMKLTLHEDMKYVEKLVELHMRPQNLVDENITDSAVRRLLFEAGDDIDDLMTLCEADITSKNEQKVHKYLKNFEIVRQKLKDIEEKDHVRNFQPPIDGQEIMDMFGLPPSQMVGTLKKYIKDAILDGIVPNEYEAVYNFLLNKANEKGLNIVEGYKKKNAGDVIVKEPVFSMIVAIDENFAIGKNGKMLIHLPGDLKYFKETTSNHTVVMGRKTFESLPKGALPNRRNIVLSRKKDLVLDGCEVVHDIDELKEKVKNEKEVFIIGGGDIYNIFKYKADFLYITSIHCKFDEADTFFPKLNMNEWVKISARKCHKDEKNSVSYTFEKYERRK